MLVGGLAPPDAVHDPRCDFNLLSASALVDAGTQVLLDAGGVRLLPSHVDVQPVGVLAEGVREVGHCMLLAMPSVRSACSARWGRPVYLQ